VWDALRIFTTHYFIDDLLQRLFLVWILILAVVYGINAPFAFASEGEPDSLKILIAVVLVAKVSFLFGHFVHTIFVPFLKRELIYEIGTTLITAALWIAAIWAPYPTKLVLLALGNFETPAALLLASPYGDKFILPKGLKKRDGTERHVARYEGFFIIILGEGKSFSRLLETWMIETFLLHIPIRTVADQYILQVSIA
jgi:hypothetical protein